jgi:lipopolysaccharide transport protein LptA
MNIRYSTLIKLILSISIFISYPAFAQNEALQSVLGSGISLKQVKANHASLDNKNKTGAYSGGVTVTTYDGMTMICERLEVKYENTGETKEGNKFQPLVNSMIATGDIKFDQAEKGISATAEKVEYSRVDGTLVLTGSPVFKMGDNVFNASKITYGLINETVDIDEPDGIFAPSEKR